MPEFGPPPQLTQQDLLAVLSRNLEDHWIGGLLGDPSSSSMLIGMATMFLRAQDASDEDLDINGFILTALGGAPAVSTVRLERPNGAQVTIDTDLRFLDDRGMVWRPSAPYVILASGAPQVEDVPIETERTGYWLNSFEPLVYLSLDTLPDPNLVVTAGVDPATGGATPFLDLLGRERGQHRQPGETDDAYRHRIHRLEDAVSPTALAETILTVLDSDTLSRPIADQIVKDGLRVLREPFIDSGQPVQRGLAGELVAFFDDTFYDDPKGPLPRDRQDACAWFDIHLPSMVDPDDTTMFWDDGFADDSEQGFVDQLALSGMSAAIELIVNQLVDELNRRRAACVLGRIIFGEDQLLDRHPPPASLSQLGAWTQVGGTDEADAVGDHDGDDSYMVTTTASGTAFPSTASDLRFDYSAPDRTPVAISRVRLFARVRRGTTATGVNPALLFVIQPTTSGSAVRPLWDSYPREVDHDDWRLYVITLDENPHTAAPWALADIAGTFRAGVANAVLAGPTDELRVSELRLEFTVDYE